MKKYLKYILFIALIIIPFKVNASSLSVTLNCPAGGAAGQTISCSVTTSNSGDINSVMISYSFSSGVSLSSFTPAGSFGLYNPKPTGVQLGQPGGALPASGTLGTLAVTLPATAQPGQGYTIGLNPISGSNTAYEDVSAPATSRTVTIYSGNNYLSSLSISGAAINFNKDTHVYTVNIDAPQVTISGAVEDSRASVAGLGTKNLREGKNTFSIVVTAQNGGQRTYTIYVNRPYSQQPQQPTTPTPETPPAEEPTDPNAPELPLGGIHEIEGPNTGEKDSNTKLKKLTIDKISMEFIPEVTEYEYYVDYDISEIKITAESESKKAKIDGNTTQKLIVGRNIIRVTVTAEDGKVRVYEIVVNRDKEEKATKNNKLQKIEIEGQDLKFNADQNTYTVKTSENSLDIKVTLANNNSTYSIKGNNNLVDGSIIRIKVADEDGNINVYEIKVEKEPKKEEKKSNIGLIIIIIVLSLIGVGEMISTIFFYKKVKKLDNDDKNISKHEDKKKEEPKVEEPEILTMTGEIKPVGQPVKKD